MPFPLILALSVASAAMPLFTDVFKWMTKAEKVYKKPGQGRKKRKFVIDAVTDAAIKAGAPEAETKAAAKEVGILIDNAVAMSRMVNSIKRGHPNAK